MRMYRRVLLLAIAVAVVCADPGRVMRQPAQRDEPVDDDSTKAAVNIDLSLSPSGRVQLLEGEDITFECKISNKPRNSQVQWYYMIRNPVDKTFDNFTILANEAATVDTRRYSVWTTPPNLYSLKIDEMRPPDSGEYCCFLYVSYSETYRQTTDVKVGTKKPPTTTPFIPRSTAAPQYRYAHGSAGMLPDNRIKHSAIDDIIEEAVEHDIESELGKKLNITMIKNNVKAQYLIHNATEEIKSLLNIKDDVEREFANGTAKLKITRQMQGASSQVKTVVTTLISRISNVDATLAQALTPALGRSRGQADYTNQPAGPYAARESAAIPDWRTIYNQYKQNKDEKSEEIETPDQGPPAYNVVPNAASDYDSWEDEQLEMEEEQDNQVDHQASAWNVPQRQTGPQSHSTKKCEYQLVINEFDPSQCPSMGSARSAGAMYYEGVDNKAPAYTQQPIGNAAPVPDNAQLSRIENRLIEEMANSKMVNKTVLMHDSMLVKTEQMIKEQTSNISNLEGLVKDLRRKLAYSEEGKAEMDKKVTNVMLNILEVNKRLDVAMSTKGTPHFGKEISVLSAPETIACDKHPNVSHYKDCAEIAEEEAADSGVYYIRPLYSACPIPVWCDMDTYPGGWTVIQRREGGAVDFNRKWREYRRGFGHVTAEHWLGNDNIFLLTNQASYMMRTDLWDFYDSRVFAEYRNFKTEGERDEYRLTVGNYSGTAGDGMKSHNKHKFSTQDHDNDMWQDYHCANEWEGGWWFTNCWSSYLNGQYYNTSSPPYNGISWREWKEEQLYKSEIKIRPVYQVRSDSPSDQEDIVEVSTSDDQTAAQGDQPRQNARVGRRKYNNAGS